MDSYIIIISILGVACLGMAWMPALAKRIHVSYSIIYVLFGFLLYVCIDGLPEPDPRKEENVTMRLTEMTVIISLMGTGLKINKPFSLRNWAIPFRLVSVTMLLSIICTTLLGYYWLGFAIPSALLLGAALAPTDPVLASDVQVGPPQEKSNGDVRFSLTAEGGLNDGMAFPFTWLAITLALHPFAEDVIQSWFIRDFLLKISVGTISGLLLGKGLAYLVFKLPGKAKLNTFGDGFVALSATLLVYGVTELLHGYGFIAVFISAVTLRNVEMDDEYHEKLHAFTNQIERIFVAIVLILFGGSIADGILSTLTWKLAGFAGLAIFLVRPICTYLSLFKARLQTREKAVISFFGIKGVGSLFYLSFALTEAHFEHGNELWAVVSLIVLCSIVIHGVTATKAMAKVEGETS
jgi:NhaP-type Na+/H+ or K+/H+ antiporter